jgi:hypothetical protein
MSKHVAAGFVGVLAPIIGLLLGGIAVVTAVGVTSLLILFSTLAIEPSPGSAPIDPSPTVVSIWLSGILSAVVLLSVMALGLR